MTDARVHRGHVEALIANVPAARVHRGHAEALSRVTPEARTQRGHVEALYGTPAVVGYPKWWDGSVKRVASLRGWWDGSVIRPLKEPTVFYPPFTPTAIAGLTLWIDASQGSYTDNQKLFTSIPDYSPAARTMNITGGNEPYFRASVRGHPTFEWVSPAYGLYSTTDWNPGAAGLTFFFVGQIIGGSYPMLVVHGPDPDGFEMRHDGSSMQIVLRYGTHGVVYSHGTPDTVGNDTVHALRVRGAAGSDAYINNVKVTGAGVTMPNVPQALYVGRRQGGYPYFGTMREVLVYAGPLSDADMTQVYNYLKAKWGLP